MRGDVAAAAAASVLRVERPRERWSGVSSGAARSRDAIEQPALRSGQADHGDEVRGVPKPLRIGLREPDGCRAAASARPGVECTSIVGRRRARAETCAGASASTIVEAPTGSPSARKASVSDSRTSAGLTAPPSGGWRVQRDAGELQRQRMPVDQRQRPERRGRMARGQSGRDAAG